MMSGSPNGPLKFELLQEIHNYNTRNKDNFNKATESVSQGIGESKDSLIRPYWNNLDRKIKLSI